MKKLIAVFCFGIITLNVNADERYAHEYSSENDDERHERRRDDGYESENREQRSFQPPRYQQNYQQGDKQTREDNRWR